MSLKTVKDLEKPSYTDGAVIIPIKGYIKEEDLKATAIECYHHIINLDDTWAKFTAEEFIEYFFNLTEEDIKLISLKTTPTAPLKCPSDTSLKNNIKQKQEQEKEVQRRWMKELNLG